MQLRGADGGKGSEWFGFSTRARVIIYNNMLIKREQVLNYEDLAKPELKGKVCTPNFSRSFGHRGYRRAFDEGAGRL